MALDRTKLTDHEKFWCTHQKALAARGYMLRARYLPDWKPSWLGTDKDLYDCEDSYILMQPSIFCDAKRISDNLDVILKCTKPSMHAEELSVLQRMTSLYSEKNHCIPLYDSFSLPGVADLIILVIPLMRKTYSPPFETIGEAVECFRQLFEGLQYMHSYNVAHRNIAGMNVMMDGSLFPDGWHPRVDHLTPDFQGPAKSYTRTEKPPTYYLVGFEISKYYDPEEGPPMDVPVIAIDKTVPEFQGRGVPEGHAWDEIPMNPFFTDVYCMGNLIRTDFMSQSDGFDFMKSLVAGMVQGDPKRRPTMDQVVTRFDDIRSTLTAEKLCSRIVNEEGDRTRAQEFRHSLTHWASTSRQKIRELAPTPNRHTSV